MRPITHIYIYVICDILLDRYALCDDRDYKYYDYDYYVQCIIHVGSKIAPQCSSIQPDDALVRFDACEICCFLHVMTSNF